jgi:hypothetical protein
MKYPYLQDKRRDPPKAHPVQWVEAGYGYRRVVTYDREARHVTIVEMTDDGPRRVDSAKDVPAAKRMIRRLVEERKAKWPPAMIARKEQQVAESRQGVLF